MKGIILAGGSGSRLYPITWGMSKQLISVYDKPMIYYALALLMLANIREILIITNEEYVGFYKKVFGNGESLGLKIEYAAQDKPRGLADAFIIGERFIDKDNVMLVLGDNIFHGAGLTKKLEKASQLKSGAIIFSYKVSNPSDYGVINLDENHNVIGIEEKPQEPLSNLAVPGLYIFDNDVVKIAKKVKPSARGEIEITAIIQEYISRNKIEVFPLGRGCAWFDTGTPDRLLEATQYIKAIQTRQGYIIACLEEISFNKGWISSSQLINAYERMKNTNYGEYILGLLKQNNKYRSEKNESL